MLPSRTGDADMPSRSTSTTARLRSAASARRRRSFGDVPGSLASVDRMQQGGADQIGRVARAQLAHGFGAVAFEGARADLHPQGTLLVGIAPADEVQHLAFTFGQGFLAKFSREHHARGATALAWMLGPPLPTVPCIRLER